VGNRLLLSCRGRGTRVAPGTRHLLARRLRRAMRAAGLRDVELALSLSDDEELRALNRAHAGLDHATDVLSFAQRPERGRGGVPRAGGLEPLGDVVISVEYARRQAAAAGRALPGELFHLAVHGLVHLLGYDHRDAREERVMFGYERALRQAALAAGPPRRINPPARGR
jgi:probable rRNA maturation factor